MPDKRFDTNIARCFIKNYQHTINMQIQLIENCIEKFRGFRLTKKNDTILQNVR